MLIEVFNDDEKVFYGILSEFLEINDNDEFLVDLLSNKTSGDSVVHREYHSGNWLINFL